MNSKGIAALKDEDICMKCLKNKSTHTYSICYRGYGSRFDGLDTRFQLCDECYDKKYKVWTDEVSNDDGYGEEYEYEDDIQNFIKSLPLESQELFYNRFSSGYFAYGQMNPQDWIDYELDELPHEKCKEYCMYSPQEIKAYEERFPNCKQVYLKKYSDGSACTECCNGARGGEDRCTDDDVSDKCYMCNEYEPTDGDMKIIDEVSEYYKNEKSRLIHMLQYASNRLVELENSVKDYMDKHEYE